MKKYDDSKEWVTVLDQQDSENNYARDASFYVSLDLDVHYFNYKVIW